MKKILVVWLAGLLLIAACSGLVNTYPNVFTATGAILATCLWIVVILKVTFNHLNRP